MGKNPLDLWIVVSPERQVRPGQVLPRWVVRLECVPPGFDQPEQAVIDLAAVEGALGASRSKTIAKRRFESVSDALRSWLSFSRFLFSAADLRFASICSLTRASLLVGIKRFRSRELGLLVGVEQRQDRHDGKRDRHQSGGPGRRRDCAGTTSTTAPRFPPAAPRSARRPATASNPRPTHRRWRSAGAGPSPGTSGRSLPGRAALAGCASCGGSGGRSRTCSSVSMTESPPNGARPVSSA